MKAYGNMTNVEKEMNKDDLLAWKRYDNNQYSMIPGHSTNKKIPIVREPKYASPPGRSMKAVNINENKIRTQEERLHQYGLLYKAPSPQTRHGVKTIRTSMDVATNPVMHPQADGQQQRSGGSPLAYQSLQDLTVNAPGTLNASAESPMAHYGDPTGQNYSTV